MKSKVYFLFTTIIVLLQVLTTGAAAQSAPPGSQSGPVSPTDSSVTDQTLAFGKPGLSLKYEMSFGTNEQAYLSDVEHINGPSSLFSASDGIGHFDLFVTEEYGSRLLKYNYHDINDKGIPVWQSGTSGLADWASAGYAYPKDAAIAQDGTIWTVNSDNVARTASNGSVMWHVPPNPNDVADALRFVDLQGIAFDTGGRMYLADAARKRIQVFTMNGGLPEYSTTLAQTDAPGQIAIDSSDNVYVVAPQNNYVQRCAPDSTTWPWTWTCTSFDTDLNSPRGLGIDTANNIYIADSGNKRVVECTAANTCTALVSTGLANPSDVTVTPDGEIYIADIGNHVIWHYTGTPTVSDIYAGQSGVPYLTDNNHFNLPRGITIDSKGAMIILEEHGHRMIKIDRYGKVLWTQGLSGNPGSASNQFDSPRAITNDSSGTLYVGDNNGVRVYNGLNGLYIKSLTKPADDKYAFQSVSGIAVDSRGYIYVSDKARHRVTVYDKYYTYLRQFGVDDQCAIDTQHLCAPMGITLDRSGNLYIADSGNYRVQKFNKYGNFIMTFGTTLPGDALDRMNTAVDVAVDILGYVYVADEFNNRMLVFDKSGAFSTSVGGEWGGTHTSQFRSAGGVGVDPSGKIYVADLINSRIQRFARRVSYFNQKNINGFGSKNNMAIASLGTFKGLLYAGTFNLANQGAQLWRKESSGWRLVVNRAFEDSTIGSIESLVEFNGYLYASTGWGESGIPGQIWRTPDGLTWLPVMRDGFGDPLNISILELFKINGSICGTTRVPNASAHGAEAWCSPSGEPGTWTRLVDNGFGDQNNTAIPALISVNGILFAGTENNSTGAQVWRKDPNQAWVQITPSDFAANGLTTVSSIAFYKSKLYVGPSPYGAQNAVPAYQCSSCNGSDWQGVNISGIGNPSISRVSDFIPAITVLYAIVNDPVDGAEIWRSIDGTTWKQVGFGGMGDSNNLATQYGESHALYFGSRLYWGSWNSASGGEIWKYCPGLSSCN